MKEAEKRRFIEELRGNNEHEYGPDAQQALEVLLAASMHHDWMYVFELAQNALDAGATRLSYTSDGSVLRFQHDGPDQLEESHVRALSRVGGSTKGLSTIGFMGVGFKSVFSRFRTARVCGSGWRFRFDIGVERGDFGTEVTRWFDALLPQWDPQLEEPDPEFTTLFRMERPILPERPIDQDLAHLQENGLTPLAVLAARGLRNLTINEDIYSLNLEGCEVSIEKENAEQTMCWRLFRACYRPTDAAMGALLTARRKLTEELTDDGQRKERKVFALLPLDARGIPIPPEHAFAYTTLPTTELMPTGFHVQADWLVNVERQGLRDIDGNAWQQEIVAQIPELIGQLLEWLASPEVTDDQRAGGYQSLRVPDAEGEQINRELHRLRDTIKERLIGRPLVPIYGQGARRFCPPETVARLKDRFLSGFGHRPDWRPDILFGCETLDERLMGQDARMFADWLDWGRDLEFEQMPWPDALPDWWERLEKDDQINAVLALWTGTAERGWDSAPVVPTEGKIWVPAAESIWLNEEPPTTDEPDGREIRTALAGYLPTREQIPLRRVTNKVGLKAPNRYTSNADDPVFWVHRHNSRIELADLIARAVNEAPADRPFPLVELTGWARGLGPNRQDLVPAVLTEAGPRPPEQALMADPLVEGGEHRRHLFPKLPALDELYAALDDPDGVVVFLKALGVRGHGKLEEIRKKFSRQHRPALAQKLGIDLGKLKDANGAGYTLIDYELPLELDAASAHSLQDWLTRENRFLKDRGHLSAESYYYGSKCSPGTRLCSWVEALSKATWVLGSDGARHRPADLLLEAHPDFEDALVAVIDAELASRLQAEGLEFGAGVPRSAAVRRLLRRGAEPLTGDALAELLEEAKSELDSRESTEEAVREAIGQVRVRGKVPVSRLVERTGSGQGQRGNLGAWVLALGDLEPRLVDALRALIPGIPQTTTGSQALSFLQSVWSERPTTGIDELRRHIAAAYRYTLEDAKNDQALSGAWLEAKTAAMLYGGRQWHPLGPSLAVDDVHSPLVKRLLAGDRFIVSSAHLGDEPGQITAVARELGIGLLSKTVKLESGLVQEQPDYAARIRALTQGLARLENRTPLEGIRYLDRIALRVDRAYRSIRAYVDDGILNLSGSPSEFAAEAASQLVEHFQLSQRGLDVPFLTMALATVDDEAAFDRSVSILSDALDVDLLVSGTDADNDGADDEDGTNSSDGDSRGGENSGREGKTGDGGDSGSGGGSGSGKGPGGSGGTGGRGGSRGGDGSSSRGGSGGGGGSGRSSGTSNRPYWIEIRGDGSDGTGDHDREARNDHREKAAVLSFEQMLDRIAEAQEDGNEGFDVESRDPNSGRIRRIEIKGMSGDFDETGAVAISWRQFEMAMHNQDENLEYWLYVVDQNGSNNPGVHPIAWTRHRGRLKFLFEGKCWLNEVERGRTAFQPTALDAGDSLDGFDPPEDEQEQ